MRFLPLVWAGLWRRPARTILTALSVVFAFLLFGLLQGINAGFSRAIADAHREFLVTNTRVRGGGLMPIAALTQIRSIPGVTEVAPRAYFMGKVRPQDPDGWLSAIATTPDIFFDVLPGLVVTKQGLAAMRDIRSAMLVTEPLLHYYGWKIGDTVPVQSDLVKRDGSKTWTFQIVGTIGTPRARSASYFGVINYDYLNESRVESRDTAEMFYLRIADPNKAVATAAAVDRIFANSSHETRTRSQQERAEYQAKQMGDVSLFTDAIVVAVIFTLAFVTGNTLRQSLEQRRAEFSVLKTLGYGNGAVLILAFAEALLLCVPPAVVGLALAYLLAPLAREDIGIILVSPAVVAVGIGSAAALALLGSAPPASRLARRPIATSLSRR